MCMHKRRYNKSEQNNNKNQSVRGNNTLWLPCTDGRRQIWMNVWRIFHFFATHSLAHTHTVFILFHSRHFFLYSFPFFFTFRLRLSSCATRAVSLFIYFIEVLYRKLFILCDDRLPWKSLLSATILPHSIKQLCLFEVIFFFSFFFWPVCCVSCPILSLFLCLFSSVRFAEFLWQWFFETAKSAIFYRHTHNTNAKSSTNKTGNKLVCAAEHIRIFVFSCRFPIVFLF